VTAMRFQAMTEISSVDSDAGIDFVLTFFIWVVLVTRAGTSQTQKARFLIPISMLKTRVVGFSFVELYNANANLGSLESCKSWSIITSFVPVLLDPIELRRVLKSALLSFERFDEVAMLSVLPLCGRE